MSDSTLDLINKLSPKTKRMILQILHSSHRNEGANYLPNHWLMNRELFSLFGIKLAMYHAVTGTPLNKSAFENILVESCNDVGISGSIASSKTAEIDATINNKNVSLKSEGRIHDKIHISKFCELGWGNWDTAEDLYFKIHKQSSTDTNRTFESRIDAYDIIMSLRHEISDNVINYELLEIPTKIFRRVLDIPLSNYESELANSKSKTYPKSFNIQIPWTSSKKNARNIVVKFDGGGERKLTITLPKESAKVIATWSFNLNL